MNWLKTRNSPRSAGFGDRQLDAGERVADVEEAAGLVAGAVDGQRVADHRLQAEAVEHGAEDLVVVEAGDQALVAGGLLGLDPVDDALVEVGRAQAPGAAGEVDVGRVVDLRAVVQRGRQLRERQRVLAPLVLDLDVALLDVDVGLAVLAHRPELDQVALGDVVADREEQVEVADHVARTGSRPPSRARPSSRAPRPAGRSGRPPRGGSRRRPRRGSRRPRPRRRSCGSPCRRSPPRRRSAARGRAIGVSESVPAPSTQRRRTKLSTTETSWPRAENLQGRRPAEVAVAPEDEDSHRRGRVDGRAGGEPRA